MAAAAAAQSTAPSGNTVYVANLNDRIQLPKLLTGLRELFSEYGDIIDIIAKKNLKAKGQAFVVFDNAQSATRAIQDIDGFEFFAKPMTCAFAKTKSDATVERGGTAEQLEAHKRHRLAEKERKRAQEDQDTKLKRPPPSDAPSSAQPPVKKGLRSTGASRAGIVPDEYLPPNRILFLQNLPEDYDDEALSAIFGRFEGFKEVRVPPGNRGIGFVEYEAEAGAITAKEHTAGMSLGAKPNQIKVTFQRK